MIRILFLLLISFTLFSQDYVTWDFGAPFGKGLTLGKAQVRNDRIGTQYAFLIRALMYADVHKLPLLLNHIDFIEYLDFSHWNHAPLTETHLKSMQPMYIRSILRRPESDTDRLYIATSATPPVTTLHKLKERPFLKKMWETFTNKISYALLAPTPGYYPIALHFRAGSCRDTLSCINDAFPEMIPSLRRISVQEAKKISFNGQDLQYNDRFPPLSFYISALEYLGNVISQPAIVYVFTDAQNPQNVVKYLQRYAPKHFTIQHVTYDTVDVPLELLDMFSLTKCKSLIAPAMSIFSRFAARFRKYEYEVVNKETFFYTDETSVYRFGKSFIVKDTKRKKRLLRQCVYSNLSP